MVRRVAFAFTLMALGTACSADDPEPAALRLELPSRTLALKPGGSGSLEVTLLDESQTEDVELTLQGLPDEVSAAPAYLSAFSPTTRVTAQAAPSASLGTTGVRLVARVSGTAVAELPLNLTVHDPGRPVAGFGTDGRVTIPSSDEVLTVWSPSVDRAVIVAGSVPEGIDVIGIESDGTLRPSTALPIVWPLASASRERLYVGGVLSGCREDCVRIYSLGPDGAPDPSWPADGEVPGFDAVERILDLAAFDGGVRVLGSGNRRHVLIELDENVGVTHSAWSNGALGDGKVGMTYRIVGAGVVAYATDDDRRISTMMYRFDRNLTLETGFAGGAVSIFDVMYQTMTPAPDGGFYACGFGYGDMDPLPHAVVHRWTPAGTRDGRFGLGGSAYPEVGTEFGLGTCTDLVAGPDGLAVRSRAPFETSSWLGKLLPDGTVDRDFGDDGALHYRAVSEVRSLTRGAEGEIVFAFRDEFGIQIQKLHF